MASHLTGRGEQAHFIDASKNFILTNDNHGEAEVDFEATYAAVEARLRPLQGVMVITGFVASTPEGRPTTLGRNGSDYTASLVGAAVHAQAVEIWKDVDGVLTADPRYVKGTIVLDEISMVSSKLFSDLDAVGKHVRGDKRPFGGGAWWPFRYAAGPSAAPPSRAAAALDPLLASLERRGHAGAGASAPPSAAAGSGAPCSSVTSATNAFSAARARFVSASTSAWNFSVTMFVASAFSSAGSFL
jgi:hypothetical protein